MAMSLHSRPLATSSTSARGVRDGTALPGLNSRRCSAACSVGSTLRRRRRTSTTAATRDTSSSGNGVSHVTSEGPYRLGDADATLTSRGDSAPSTSDAILAPNAQLERVRDQPLSDFSDTERQSGSGSGAVLGPQLGHPELPYSALTFLSAMGAAETAYLTFEKLFGGLMTCPFGGSCNDVLNSSYGSLLGIPLSLYGFLSYASVALLTQISKTNSSRGLLRDNARWALLGLTTAMAGVSAFLLYIIKFELDSTFCSYCYFSAALSFSLFGLSFRGFSQQEISKVLLPQSGVLAATVLALSLGYSDPRSALAGVQEIDLPPIEPEVTTESTWQQVKLAQHLSSVGAKMYGAFWCSHCHEQKQAFGQEASKLLPYVECYPDGYRRGVRVNEACEDAKIEGFPTWVINGELRPGEQDLKDLAILTGFVAKQ